MNKEEVVLTKDEAEAIETFKRGGYDNISLLNMYNLIEKGLIDCGGDSIYDQIISIDEAKLVSALYNGYEVEKDTINHISFTDIVNYFNESNDKILVHTEQDNRDKYDINLFGKIKCLDFAGKSVTLSFPDGTEYRYADNVSYALDSMLRFPTKEELEFYKFASIGRGVGEFKIGDIVVFKNYAKHLIDNKTIDDVSKVYKAGNIKSLYPVEYAVSFSS